MSCKRRCCRTLDRARDLSGVAGRLSPYQIRGVFDALNARGGNGMAYVGAGRVVLLVELPKWWAKTEPKAPVRVAAYTPTVGFGRRTHGGSA